MDAISEPSLVTTLQLRRGEVTCLDTAGTRLVTGSGDGTLRLWRWNRDVTWLEQAEYPRAHRYGVTGARFAPSGLLLASIGIDGAARIWAVHEALALRRTMAAPDAAAARSLLWTSSDRLVVGHDDGGLRVWIIGSGTLLAYLRPHEGALYALATLASDALLLTACTEGVLKIFEFHEIVTNGREGDGGPTPLLWEDGAHDLGALCAAGGCGDAATGGHDGRVRVWRVVRGEDAARRVEAGAVLSGHTAAVTALSWVRDTLASASLDRTARLWSVASALCIRVLHAHSRYLTCVTLADDLRYMVTGSNDKSIRTWSLGSFCFSDDIETPCNPLAHFALGDLEVNITSDVIMRREGIGPVDDDESTNMENAAESLVCTSSETRCLVRVSHDAAVNSIAASKERIATACSDGYVRVFKWFKQEEFKIELELEVSAHSYPVLAVDFGADGTLLLSAGLDGCARLWDIQSGCQLVVLSAESVNASGIEGGGGVRDARISSHRPTLLVVASDDGHAAVWGIDPPCTDPLHVYTGLAEAAICCAWSEDGRLLVTGGEAGELRLLLPPPCPEILCQNTDAHDLGVLSCDFAPALDDYKSENECQMFLLATGGRDALVKLWWVEVKVFNESIIESGSLKLIKALAAHGGAVQCVRWGLFGGSKDKLMLATGGTDRWARVWRVALRGAEVDAQAVFAVPAGAAGGAPAVRLLSNGDNSLLVVGSLSGVLALWMLPTTDPLDEIEGHSVRVWGTDGVAKWIREYITRPQGSSVSVNEETRLIEAARGAHITGVQLLDKSLDYLMDAFGYDTEGVDSDTERARGETHDRLRDEILWLRRDKISLELEEAAPHSLRCPLTHKVMREPARAADGFTYDRLNILDWMLATGTEELRSPMTGRLLNSPVVEPNYGVRAQLRQYCGWPQELR